MQEVIKFHSHNGLQGLKMETIPFIMSRDNHVRIKEEAFYLNCGDFDLMENKYVSSMDFPIPINQKMYFKVSFGYFRIKITVLIN